MNNLLSLWLMKSLSLLFAIAILFLAVKPEVDYMAFSERESDCCAIACGAEDTHSEKDEDNACSKESCNPFHSCCNNISYYKSSDLDIRVSELNISKNLVFFYNSIFKSEYENSFWQPPKIA